MTQERTMLKRQHKAADDNDSHLHSTQEHQTTQEETPPELTGANPSHEAVASSLSRMPAGSKQPYFEQIGGQLGNKAAGNIARMVSTNQAATLQRSPAAPAAKQTAAPSGNAPAHISEAGLRLIEDFEAFFDHPYDDGTGVMTIGYGHVIKKGEHFTKITKAQAEDMLRGEVAEAEAIIHHAIQHGSIKVALNQNQFDALVSFVFNTGEPMNTSANHDLLGAINSGDVHQVETQLARYIHAANGNDGKVRQGLLNRRHREGALYASGAAAPTGGHDTPQPEQGKSGSDNSKPDGGKTEPSHGPVTPDEMKLVEEAYHAWKGHRPDDTLVNRLSYALYYQRHSKAPGVFKDAKGFPAGPDVTSGEHAAELQLIEAYVQGFVDGQQAQGEDKTKSNDNGANKTGGVAAPPESKQPAPPTQEHQPTQQPAPQPPAQEQKPTSEGLSAEESKVLQAAFDKWTSAGREGNSLVERLTYAVLYTRHHSAATSQDQFGFPVGPDAPLPKNAPEADQINADFKAIEQAVAGYVSTHKPKESQPEENGNVPEAIRRLNLEPSAERGAMLLKQRAPGVVFTSGRRSMEDQARAMAQNIVGGGGKHWIENTYANTEIARKLQAWVNAHFTHDQATMQAGLLQILRDNVPASYAISRHLSGLAFDVEPGSAPESVINALPGLNLFLTSEGGLTRWHLQFNK